MGMIGNAPYQGVIDTGNILDGAITSAKIKAAADLISKLGFTPVNKAGDTMSGALAFGAQKPNQIGSIKTYRYLATVSQSAYATLLNSSGVALASTDTGKIYRVRLVTTGTGTNTGVTYLAHNVDSLGWMVRKVSGGDIYSNTPGLVVSGSVPKIATAHPGTYDIEVSVEELDGQNDGAHWGVFGLDSAMTANYEGVVTTPYQPAFLCYGNSVTAAYSGVLSWVVSSQRGNCFASNVFTAPVAGWYQFHATLDYQESYSESAAFYIRRNGSSYAAFDHSDLTGVPNWLTHNLSIVMPCAVGDTVDVQVATSMHLAHYAPWSMFSGALLG